MGVETRNYIVHDLETSSLNDPDPLKQGEIVQIAATTLQYHDYSPHINGNFEIVLKPQFPERASPKAIEKIGAGEGNRTLVISLEN